VEMAGLLDETFVDIWQRSYPLREQLILCPQASGMRAEKKSGRSCSSCQKTLFLRLKKLQRQKNFRQD
ncbi:MAG: hypothetical protein ACQEUB_15040, partial [Thermodesulfobacteriota bacterium]